jgi:hypothetical protein
MSFFDKDCESVDCNKNKTKIDNDFNNVYSGRNWSCCIDIVKNKCFPFAYCYACKFSRKYFRGVDIQITAWDLATDVIYSIIRQLEEQIFTLKNQSICSYISGSIRMANSSFGVTFRKKDFPKKVKAAGGAGIELYIMRVKYGMSKTYCFSQMKVIFNLSGDEFENLFSIVDPFAKKWENSIHIHSTTINNPEEDGNSEIDIPSYDFRPDLIYENAELKSIINKIIKSLPSPESEIMQIIYENGEKNAASYIKSDLEIKSPYYDIKKAKKEFKRRLKEYGIDSCFS